jgi:predicted nucleic acid-binding protein
MRIAITDANIFIDLIHIELHNELFEVDLEIHSTISVFDELSEFQQKALAKYITEGKLSLHLNSVENLPSEIAQNRRLSPSDKSVFSLAIQLDAIVLTGDGLLRKISSYQKIEVHGVFWLFDRFLEKNMITKKKALFQLKRLMDYNKRLPMDECQARISEWS